MSTKNSTPTSTSIFGPRVPSIGRGLEFLGVPDPRIARIRRQSAELLTGLQARTGLYPFTTVSEIPSPGLFPVPGMLGVLRRREALVDPFRPIRRPPVSVGLVKPALLAGPGFIPVPGVLPTVGEAEWRTYLSQFY